MSDGHVQANVMVVRRRIYQVTVSMSDTGARVSIEMGSLLRTQEEDMDRRVRKLLPGEGTLS